MATTNLITRSTGACTITWPTALMNDGRKLLIKDAGLNASVFNTTVETGGTVKLHFIVNHH